MQLIVHLPLIKIVLPANAGFLFDQLMKIAAFDPFDTTPYWEALLSLDPTVPVDQNFEALGYESLYFLQNLGSLAIFFAAYFVALVFLLLCKCLCCCECCRWIIDRLSRNLLFGPLINLISGSYTAVIVSCMIHVQHMCWNSYGEITQSLATIFFLVLFLAFPLVESLYLVYRFDDLGEEEMQVRHGAFTSDLDLRRGRRVLLQPVWFYLRRIIIGVAVVFLNENAVWQFLLLIFTVLVQMIVLGILEPFESRSRVRQEILDESVVMVVLYHFMCFSDFVPDVTARLLLGYSLITFVVVWLLGRLGWNMWTNLKNLKFRLIVCRAHCWHWITKRCRRKLKDERKLTRRTLLFQKRKQILE